MCFGFVFTTAELGKSIKASQKKGSSSRPRDYNQSQIQEMHFGSSKAAKAGATWRKKTAYMNEY